MAGCLRFRATSADCERASTVYGSRRPPDCSSATATGYTRPHSARPLAAEYSLTPDCPPPTNRPAECFCSQPANPLASGHKGLRRDRVNTAHFCVTHRTAFARPLLGENAMAAEQDPDTEQLLEAAARGDGQARGRLLQRHRVRLRRMLAVR